MGQTTMARSSGGAHRIWIALAGLGVLLALLGLGQSLQRALPGLVATPVAGAEAQPASAWATDAALAEASARPRVLVFYDPSRSGDCVECQLHALRFAYYAFQFHQAGAEVLGVVGGLREGSASLDPSLELPWQTAYDLSGRLAEFYGVERKRNHNPTIVVLDREGRVRYRGQPRGVDDRIEGEVLTTLAAVVREQADDTAVARAVHP